MSDAQRKIDLKNDHSGSPFCGKTSQDRAVISEMIAPLLKTWMKERDGGTGFWIDSSDIWAFVAIALKTSQSQVFGRS